MAGKLYEILAVEGDAQGRAAKLLLETIQTFNNKENLFKGKRRLLTLFGKTEDKAVEMRAIEDKDSTQTKVESTVPDSLNYLGCILGDYWDVMFQKEASNQISKADIVMEDGSVLLKDVPVTFLLCMENRLKDFKPVLDAIPTLSPGIDWKVDETYALSRVYKAPVVSDVKTKEDTDYRIVAPATDKHPAQVVAAKTQFNIGQYVDTSWSGLISPAEKARLLERLDKLVAAVKQARQRANSVEAVTTKVSNQLVTALLGGWYDRTKMNTVELR